MPTHSLNKLSDWPTDDKKYEIITSELATRTWTWLSFWFCCLPFHSVREEKRHKREMFLIYWSRWRFRTLERRSVKLRAEIECCRQTIMWLERKKDPCALSGWERGLWTPEEGRWNRIQRCLATDRPTDGRLNYWESICQRFLSCTKEQLSLAGKLRWREEEGSGAGVCERMMVCFTNPLFTFLNTFF